MFECFPYRYLPTTKINMLIRIMMSDIHCVFAKFIVRQLYNAVTYIIYFQH
jgi:hypothetical protein